MEPADIRCKQQGGFHYKVIRNVGGPDPDFKINLWQAQFYSGNMPERYFEAGPLSFFVPGASLFVLQEKASGSQKERSH